MLLEGEEPWNKWCHPGVSATWIRADFVDLPPNLSWPTSALPNCEKGVKLLGYSLSSAAGENVGRDPATWTLLGRKEDGKWATLHRYRIDLIYQEDYIQ